MSVSTTQELENEISQMEDRLATVKVVVEVEREAWRRSSRTGKRGTKWKGAAPARKAKVELSSSPATNAANGDSGGDGDFTIMPLYWDALELAQYLQTKQLTNYAQVVVYEQITGKTLLGTAPNKLRQLFTDATPSGCDPEWKAFLAECSKLHKHQRRLEKAAAQSSTEQQESKPSRHSHSERSKKPLSSVIGAAGAALVFPLISPRLPALPGSSASTQHQDAKAAASKTTFPPRKPASSNNIPMATCWNCRTRFFRPHSRKTSSRAVTSVFDSGSSSSSSMKASLSGRTYCSKECQASIESGDIRISPSLSARVKVTFHGSEGVAESSGRRGRPCHGSAGIGTTSAANREVRDTIVLATGGTTVGPVGPAIHSNTSHKTANRPRRKSEAHVRRPSKRKVTQNDFEDFDFLQVAAPKGKFLAFAPSPRREEDSRSCTPSGTSSRAEDAVARRQSVALAAASTFSATPANVSMAITSLRTPGTPSELFSAVATHNKPSPPASLVLSSVPHDVPRQCKIYQQSKYKLDPELFQANQETFSSCFGAAVASSRAADHARGNLLRLQKFLTVRALHRLSLTSRAWFELITTPSALSDALWGVHVLRIWRPSTADEVFLHDIGVLTKPERPRRMLQKLTRQVARVVLDSMKVLLNPESWQLATVMTPTEIQDIQTLNAVLARARRRPSTRETRVSKAQQHASADLYEYITVIYAHSGEIVAVSARQLIRPVDPAAPLADILQGLRNGEFSRVHCRRLRLFSQANRLPFEQWTLLPAWAQRNRAVVELFWPATDTEEGAVTLPVWHQKSMSRLQHALQQRLLGKDSVHAITKSAHEQNASPTVLLALEKFLTLCHAAPSSLATSTPESNVAGPL